MRIFNYIISTKMKPKSNDSNAEKVIHFKTWRDLNSNSFVVVSLCSETINIFLTEWLLRLNDILNYVK